jgi:hypothetical protein
MSISQTQRFKQLRRYNRYQDVEIDAFLLPHDEIGKFLAALFEEESRWIARLGSRVMDPDVRGNALFWVKVRVQLSHLIPSLLGNDMFMVHHATPEYIMLVKGPGVHICSTNVPLYGTHYTRVECLVVEVGGSTMLEDERVLMVTEMVGTLCCNRKLVTGSVESGEYLSKAAEREVFEETGIRCRFVGLLGVVNRLRTRFNRDEILIGCVLVAESLGQVPQPSSVEIVHVGWVPFLSTYTQNGDKGVASSGNFMTNMWMGIYRLIRSRLIVKVSEETSHDVDVSNSVNLSKEVPDFRGHGHTMMMYSIN